VSNSWGGGNGYFESQVDAWRKANIIPIFAAGNEGTGCNTIGYPGSKDNVIAVGAIDRNNNLGWFSSVGPGPNESQKPEISAPGVEITSASHRDDDSLTTMSGTSMACPHAAGLAALIMSKNRKIDYDGMKAILEGSASRQVNGQNRNCGNPPKSDSKDWPNYHFGYGKIDSVSALEKTTDGGDGDDGDDGDDGGNADGFKHGKTYRIDSVLDGRTLDLRWGHANDDQLVWMWDINDSCAQHWIANLESPGFRLQTKCGSENALKTLESKADNALVINQFQAFNRQKFTAESIGDGVYLIKNMENNLALQNRGRATQVASGPANRNDRAQQWKLVEV
jgi:hypothetical protein